MSKKSSKRSRTKTSSRITTSIPGFPSWLDRPELETGKDPFYRKIFIGLSIAVLLLTIFLAIGSGINADDEYHNVYSDDIVSYYSTFGADTTALNVPKGMMHYYGGLFDLLTGMTNKAIGFTVEDAGYHNVRHIFNALFGFIAMLFSALLARQIGGWRAGILGLFFIFLSPRFLGHSLMNPKDIPFAAGYIMSIYFMVLFLKQMPKPNWKTMLGIVIGIAIALGSRVGGLLLFAYLGLFAGLDFLIKNGFSGLWKDGKKVGLYAMYVIGIAVTGYFLALLFWPYGLQGPFNHPFEVLKDASHGVIIRVLFGGANIMSDATPWHYPLQWIWRTIPLFVLIGFVGSFAIIRRLFSKYHVLPVFITYFSVLFPLIYIIQSKSILYDGWRHLQFVYPAMPVIAALFWVSAESMFEKNRVAAYATYLVLGLMTIESALFIVRNHHYPYVYFNSFSGGISNAFGNYETDYWGTSVKQAIDWMEEEGILSSDMQDTVTIGTSFFYNTQVYTQKKYAGKVKLAYVRFNDRYSQDWDYGIFPSRFIKGSHLRAGAWPNSRNVYSVNANGVPLLSIEKGGGPVFTAEQALRMQDYQNAIAAFQEEVTLHPDNELAWMKVAMAYLNTGQFNESKNAAENLLKVAPDNTSGLFYNGLAAMNLGDLQVAENEFRKAIKIEEDFGSAYYYIALIQRQKNDMSGALQSIQKAIEVAPRFKEAYELAAQIYEQQGNPQQAAQIRAAAAQF